MQCNLNKDCVLLRLRAMGGAININICVSGIGGYYEPDGVYYRDIAHAERRLASTFGDLFLAQKADDDYLRLPSRDPLVAAEGLSQHAPH